MIEIIKEELIKTLNDIAFRSPLGLGYNLAVNNAIRLVEQLPDTPKKVVVPKFVADWISCRKDKMSVFRAWRKFVDYIHGTENQPWTENLHNQEVFARAWLDGYDVEQPKAYMVAVDGEWFQEFNGDNYECKHPFEYVTNPTINGRTYFDNKRQAELVAELIGGEVEEV